MHAARRFFEGLEKGVGRLGRERVGRGDNEDAAVGLERREIGCAFDPSDNADSDPARVAVVMVGLDAQSAGGDHFDIGVLRLNHRLGRVVQASAVAARTAWAAG